MSRRALVALWAIAGCYAPDIASGVACGAGGECPQGQVCDPTTSHCVAMRGADAAVDASDGAVDASICDPTEVLGASGCAIPLVAVTPAPVSPTACTTGPTTLSRSVGLDAGNRIYVVFRCGMANDGFVVTSSDGGATASTPQPLGTGLTGLAVHGGPRKVAYVATAGAAGTAVSVTHDGGVTWTTTVLDPTVPDAAWGVSLAATGDAVYVAARIGSNNVRVWRNASRGVGAFAATDVALSTVFGDVMVDPQTGDVWVGGDTPALHVRRSQDGGATFAAAIDPGASYNYSDWSFGGGSVVVTGSSASTFTLLAATDPTMVTTVTAMLPTAVTRGRAINARPDGSIYVATESSGGALTFVRFAPGATTGTSRSAGPGTGPSIVPGPGAAAPVVFTDTASTRVHLGVHVF